MSLPVTYTRHWGTRWGPLQLSLAFYRHHYGPGDDRLVVHPRVVIDVPRGKRAA